MKYLSILLSVAALVQLTSCGCPVLEPAELLDRRVREATITQFDPGWNVAADEPEPRYSIHTFEFPSSILSSGTLPNDTSVSEGHLRLLGDRMFNGTPPDSGVYIAHFFTRIPPHNRLIGDIMVVSVDTTVFPFTAKLRFKGQLARFQDSLLSGSAVDFTRFLEAHETEIDGLASSATFGGRGLGGGVSNTIDEVHVLDISGKDVSATVPVPPTAQAEAESQFQGLDVDVAIGQVYYYKARNGVEFGVLIEDIFRASLFPSQRRVTIKFAELRTMVACKD